MTSTCPQEVDGPKRTRVCSERQRFSRCVKMSKVQMLRTVVNQRLAAAAEEIFGLFEKTIAEYEEELSSSKEENERQRKLLDAVFKPEVHLTDTRVVREEVPPEQQDWSSPHIKEDQEDEEMEDQEMEDEEDPEPPHIKEEEEEVWISQEGERLQGLEEACVKFSFSPVTSEDDDEDSGEPEPEIIMPKTRRTAYDAAFKLEAINLAIEKGNRAAANKLGINESMVRRWKMQQGELSRCKKSFKAFRGGKCLWPDLENELKDWVNAQKADGRGVSTVQIRMKAMAIAAEKNIGDFRGGPSWCVRFLRRKGLSIRARTTLCQQLPADLEEKLSNFRNFTQEKIAKYVIGPQDIINIDEVPLTFDLPLTRAVNKKGESSVTEKTHFTCVLSCTASGEKLPPMVIFKRLTMPKQKFPKDVVVHVNKKGWMNSKLMKTWLTECFSKRPGGFSRRKKAMLVMDSMKAHVTDSVKSLIESTNSIQAIVPDGTKKYLQPLDIGVNRAFKVELRTEWEHWMTSGEKSFTKTGRVRQASFAEICQWVVTAWGKVTKSTIIKGFRKAEILGAPDAGTMTEHAPDSSDSEYEAGVVSLQNEEAVLLLFNSDTEDEDFCGFSGDSDDDE